MQSQPFIESVPYKVAGIVSMLVVLLAHALILALYGHVDWVVALLDGVVFASLFAISGFLYSCRRFLRGLSLRCPFASFMDYCVGLS